MKLDRYALAALDRRVRRPDYDPASIGCGIVHLGLGSFHRAHQAVYTDAVLVRDPAWGICGVSLRSRGVVDALVRQDHLYTLLVRAPQGIEARIIGSLREALCAADGMHAVVARLAAPATRIVSLTVTEKGYCHHPASGRLDRAHPDILHDLEYRDAPVSALGVLLCGLAARMAGGVPLTVLCCDNLPRNGATVRALALELAALMDPRLARWIDAEVSFPSCMVDRIVPATSADDHDVARRFGLEDDAPVSTEPFMQWVIEDKFAAGRPPWQDAGAQFVADVAPFELMKLRLLNGAHSTMAYLGYLAGHATICAASSDPLIARVVECLWDELEPTLPAALLTTPGSDPSAYRQALMQRFRNPALAHRTWQIAMDGSQKLPQRLLEAARERLARRQSVDTIALAVASWMRYVAGSDDQGGAIEVRDPLASNFLKIARAAAGDSQALGRGLLGLSAIFGDDLPHDPRFREAVQGWLTKLAANGVRATLAGAAQFGRG